MGVDLVRIFLTPDHSLGVEISWYVVVILAVLGVCVVVVLNWGKWGNQIWELDQTEIGVGDQKLTLRPNYADRTIAYRVWVEISTRKIGLEIDLDDDVIVEIYDSWYSFFQITREMLKDVPVQRLKNESTKEIVNSTIAILNDQLRPHLTKWQSRFRHWYEGRREGSKDLAPQQIQAEYPSFTELKTELTEVNRRLMAYRANLYRLASNT